jgi:hypothetical protein
MPLLILLIAIVVIGSVSLVIWTIYGYFVLPKMHKISWAYKIWSRPSHSGGLSLPLAVHMMHTGLVAGWAGSMTFYEVSAFDGFVWMHFDHHLGSR